MSLHIVQSSEPIEVKEIVTCVYAAPGVGKTSLAFTADAPLLLDFDKGAYRSANRGPSVQVGSWSDVASITAADVKGFHTLAMDTAGRALDCLTGDIIAANPKHGRGGSLTLQGYGELKSRFIAYTKMIRSFGLDIVLLAHSDEQRNGDDVIERIDVQGGSKNEIYKVADVMGRLSIKGNRRVLNFSPTDTAFGKNPAGLAELTVPDFSADPHYLAGVIAEIKLTLNRKTAEQQKEADELTAWQTRFDNAATASEMNALIPLVSDASAGVRDNAKRLMVKVALKKGWKLDPQTKQFVETAPVEPAKNGKTPVAA